MFKNLTFKDYAWETSALVFAIFNLYWSYPILDEWLGKLVFILSILVIVNIPFALHEKSVKKAKKRK